MLNRFVISMALALCQSTIALAEEPTENFRPNVAAPVAAQLGQRAGAAQAPATPAAADLDCAEIPSLRDDTATGLRAEAEGVRSAAQDAAAAISTPGESAQAVPYVGAIIAPVRGNDASPVTEQGRSCPTLRQAPR